MIHKKEVSFKEQKTKHSFKHVFNTMQQFQKNDT